MATPPSHDDWDGARLVSDVLDDLGDDFSLSAISKNIAVRDVMHGGVVSCRRSTPVGEVTQSMLDHQIYALVVLDDDQQPLGVVSQTDIIMASQVRVRSDLLMTTAKEVMTHGCITCDVHAKLADAISLMTVTGNQTALYTFCDSP